MSKTPFSATISLKCSFLKRLGSTPNNIDCKGLLADDNALEVKCENDAFKAEITELRQTSEFKEKKLVEELSDLQKLYEAEKDKTKDLELKVVNFREEALNVKKSKNEVTKSLKAANAKCETLEVKSKCLEERNDVLQKELKVKTEVTDSLTKDLVRIKKENDKFKNDYAKIKTELEDSKCSDLERNKTGIKCDKCDIIIKTQTELKTHNSIYHSHSKSSQYLVTDNFEHFATIVMLR